MTKRVLTIFLTALLFLSAIILGCATVFRIDNVTMVATVVSEESKDNVEQFREDLVELYKDKSIFSAKQRDMAGILNNYPYFHLPHLKQRQQAQLPLEGRLRLKKHHAASQPRV